MKILHVITGLRKAAGTSVFCCEVCNGLSARGYDVTLASVAPYDAEKDYVIDGKVRRILIDSLLQGDGNYDVIHIHALWTPILHKVSNWAHKSNIPVVWSPHGMLTPWAFRYKWWKKLPAWWLYQKKDLKCADLIHVTAESEIMDVRRVGLTNKTIIAPLGVGGGGGGGGVILFVSRIQKKKGLPNLLKAFATVLEMLHVSYIGRVAPIKGLGNLINASATLDHSGDWRLRIVGPDQEGHTAELKTLAADLGVSERVEFVGPKYGDELQREYASADIFVLPSYSENFGSVVVEALAHSVPVITTRGTPWNELEDHKCGWWIDIGAEPLANALKDAISLTDNERREMGLRGRKLVEEKYTWGAVVDALVNGYKKVIT